MRGDGQHVAQDRLQRAVVINNVGSERIAQPLHPAPDQPLREGDVAARGEQGFRIDPPPGIHRRAGCVAARVQQQMRRVDLRTGFRDHHLRGFGAGGRSRLLPHTRPQRRDHQRLRPPRQGEAHWRQ